MGLEKHCVNVCKRKVSTFTEIKASGIHVKNSSQFKSAETAHAVNDK
jgi:hypothetical protein